MKGDRIVRPSLPNCLVELFHRLLWGQLTVDSSMVTVVWARTLTFFLVKSSLLKASMAWLQALWETLVSERAAQLVTTL